MFTEERHRYILDKIKKDNMVKIKDLEKELNCSISTVRRDLLELEEQNLLVRVHGGAKRVYTLADEQEVKEKSSKNVQEKISIARFAVTQVNENNVIYLDAGTTTYEMIPFLEAIPGLLVVTNGVKHADHLVNHGIAASLANKTFILADHTKFDQINFAKVGELEDYFIITDKMKEENKKRKVEYDQWTKVLEASK